MTYLIVIFFADIEFHLSKSKLDRELDHWKYIPTQGILCEPLLGAVYYEDMQKSILDIRQFRKKEQLLYCGGVYVCEVDVVVREGKLVAKERVCIHFLC